MNFVRSFPSPPLERTGFLLSYVASAKAPRIYPILQTNMDVQESRKHPNGDRKWEPNIGFYELLRAKKKTSDAYMASMQWRWMRLEHPDSIHIRRQRPNKQTIKKKKEVSILIFLQMYRILLSRTSWTMFINIFFYYLASKCRRHVEDDVSRNPWS